jgi:PAS domain S-box-containing protein
MNYRDKTRQQLIDELLRLLSSTEELTVHLNTFRGLQEALRRTEDRLELAIDGAELGLWDYDLQTRDAFVSRSRAAMLGYSLAEIEPAIGSWGRLVHPDDMERITEAFIAHAEGRTRLYECEHRLRCKSGEYKWILARAKIVERDEHGNPKRLVGISFDISERKQATEALKEYAERLEEMVEARTTELAKTNDELRKENTERKRAHDESQRLVAQLQKALSEVKTLAGLLPICASCKKIRDDKGYWRRVEEYIEDHSEAVFTHSICPQCTKRLYSHLR